MAEASAATEKTAPDQNEALPDVPSSERRIGKKDTTIMSPAWIRAQPIHKASKLRRYFTLPLLVEHLILVVPKGNYVFLWGLVRPA
jgi:hypothetical protein